MKSVILAARPPISLPATSIPPALLDELLSELGSLRFVSCLVFRWATYSLILLLFNSAVYHKCVSSRVLFHSPRKLTSFSSPKRPVQAFLAGGKLGADQISSRPTESATTTREAAIATLVAGQKAENLLDFDDDEQSGDTVGQNRVDMFVSPSVANSNSNPLDGSFWSFSVCRRDNFVAEETLFGDETDLLGLFGTPEPIQTTPTPTSGFASPPPSNGFNGFGAQQSSSFHAQPPPPSPQGNDLFGDLI